MLKIYNTASCITSFNICALIQRITQWLKQMIMD